MRTVIRFVLATAAVLLAVVSPPRSLAAMTFTPTYLESPTYGHSNELLFLLSAFDADSCVCGTNVIQVVYEDTVDIRLQGAFERACRIWEDVIPSGVPVRIRVRTASLPTTPVPTLSTVRLLAYDIVGDSVSENNRELIPLSRIKGTLYSEMRHHRQFVGVSGNLSMLDGEDFVVTYNSDMMSSFYFGTTGRGQNMYDFTSVAIRDIARGLGFMCAFEGDNGLKQMKALNRKALRFEEIIRKYNCKTIKILK